VGQAVLSLCRARVEFAQGIGLAARSNRRVKKGFHCLFTLSVVSPQGERTKGRQLLHRALKPHVVDASKCMACSAPC
jgi:hypothetical protein